MSAQVVLASLNGLRSFKKAEIQEMTIRDLGGRQQAEMIILRVRILANRRLTVRQISAEVGIS
jgi:hypothetical protein